MTIDEVTDRFQEVVFGTVGLRDLPTEEAFRALSLATNRMAHLILEMARDLRERDVLVAAFRKVGDCTKVVGRASDGPHSARQAAAALQKIRAIAEAATGLQFEEYT